MRESQAMGGEDPLQSEAAGHNDPATRDRGLPSG